MSSLVSAAAGFIAGLAVMSISAGNFSFDAASPSKPAEPLPAHSAGSSSRIATSQTTPQPSEDDVHLDPPLGNDPHVDMPPALSFSQSSASNPKKSRPENHSPKRRLRISVLCGGGEHKDGGVRIWCTNYYLAMKHLGHQVQFGTVNKRPVLQTADVVVLHGGDVKHRPRLISELRAENKQLVVCVMKVNGLGLHILNQADLFVVGSWFHGLAVTRELEANYEKLLALKHIELEWNGPNAALTGPKVLHTAFTGDFTLKRRATVCYHGNDDHLNEGEGIFNSVLTRINDKIPINFVAINRGNWKRGRPSSFTVKEYLWTSQKKTYEILAPCDVGLVPQLIGRPVAEVCDSREKHDNKRVGVLSLTWKDSANAGRAFVFAQLGVPIVSGPDFETGEMFGVAGLAAEQLIAITNTEWEHHITKVLSDAEFRHDVNQRLLTYAKNHLDINKESRKLEAALLERVQKHR